jgi:feruloyl-CoA hydratase/lyase
MNTETIKVVIDDGVAKVILNRPNKKNAMNPQLHADMTHVLETLRYEDQAAF